MTDAQQPLLADGGENGGEDRGSAVAARLEAGLSAEEGAMDFEQLLQRDPDHVIQYLADKGTKQLGSFITEDTEVLPLLRDGKVWTLGASSMDIDHERVWRNYLQHDSYKANGFAAKVEVETHVVTIRNAALPDDRGILNPLLEKWQDGALSRKVFGLPAVQAVITFKWDAWAHRVLAWEFGLYLLWLLGFQMFIILFQDENLHLSLQQLARTGRGLATIAALSVSAAGMLPFLYIEACTLLEYGPWRWLNVWNLQDTLAYVLQVVIVVMYFARWQLNSEFLSVATAVQVLLLYWRIQYFARAFQPLKNSFVDTLRAVIVEVRFFMLLMLVVLYGFAGAFYILFRNEQGNMFQSYWHSVLTLFGALFGVGGFDWDFFYNSQNPVVGIILLLTFVFTMSMVLLNSLIGIMCEAAGKATDDDGTKYLCSKAQLIDELEASLPAWVRQPSWYPEFVHILKVNPDSAQKVEGSQLWALSTSNDGGSAPGGGGGEEGGEAAGGGGGDEEVKAQLAELQGQVQRLEELLRQVLAARAEE